MIHIADISFCSFRLEPIRSVSAALLLAIAALAPVARAQQFLPPITYPVGVSPQVIAAGDFNRDGIEDLAIGDSASPGSGDGRIEILLGNGDGTFRTGGSFPSGGGEPDGIVVRDFNHDGHLDLAVANYGGGPGDPSLAILFGAGNGTFGKPVVYETEKTPYGHAEASTVVAGDFNGDGAVDLVVSENPTGLVVYLGQGDGTFKKAATYTAGILPGSLVVRDLNRDGKLDLAAADSNGAEVEILLGNGDGTFKRARSFPAGSGPEGIKSRDFNGDGIPDLVVANAGSSDGTTVSVLLGVGDGTFRAPVSYPAGAEPIDVAVGDFNGDGKLDLAVADLDARDETGTSVSVLLGNGDGTFGAPTAYMAGLGPVSLVAAALNRDRCTDLAVANFFGNSVSVLLNAGGGRPRCQSRPPVPSGAEGDGEEMSE